MVQLSYAKVHRNPIFLMTFRSLYVCAEGSHLRCLYSLVWSFPTAHTRTVSVCNGLCGTASGSQEGTYESADARERVIVKSTSGIQLLRRGRWK